MSASLVAFRNPDNLKVRDSAPVNLNPPITSLNFRTGTLNQLRDLNSFLMNSMFRDLLKRSNLRADAYVRFQYERQVLSFPVPLTETVAQVFLSEA